MHFFSKVFQVLDFEAPIAADLRFDNPSQFTGMIQINV